MCRIYTILTLLSFTLLFGCSKGRVITPIDPNAPGQQPVSAPTSPSAIGKTYLALGDSYTSGQGVSAAERFPIQTRNWLQSNGVSMIDPQFIAGPSWTTYVLQNQIGNRTVGHFFDAVSLLIGVNDQYIGRDSSEYRIAFTQLLQQAIYFANERPSRVFVLSIPDYSVTPAAATSDTLRIRREIDMYNFINRQVTQLHNAQYIDITPSSREARTDPSLLAPDGLHPSGIEYRKWAELLGPVMKSVLQ